ncbi:hypothetical protein BDV98DRAFT_572963 [Pterulicium gracile]|uniref:Uncharacterized protein n=1 Tax=Pterulicium gracile TaxID=1884261 RepID=A0A5C3QAT5_9AGAR|nr:hypothetical protein BDV98DRAFT_572963 [Pterula gracilis]
MCNIMKACPAISDLTLSLNIWSPDTVSGLMKGLPLLENVKRVAIIAGISCNIPTNKAAQSLAGVMAACIKDSWKSMHTCRCSWKWEHGDSGNTEHTCALKTALCSAPALKTIHVRIGPNTSHAIFLPLLEVQSLRKIYITSYVFNHHRDRRPGHKIDLEAAMIAECTQAFGKRVVMQSDKVETSLGVKKLAVPSVITPTVVSFVPLQGLPEDVQDAIWSRVMLFATDANHFYTDEELMPGTRPRSVSPSSGWGKQQCACGSLWFHGDSIYVLRLHAMPAVC